VLELIGYSTIPDDVTVAKSRLDQALDLFLSVPWWALLAFSLIATLWLMWLSWPRQSPSIESHIDAAVVSHNWTKRAILTLIFDNELSNAVAARQDGVRYYYWTHIPAIAFDEKNKVSHFAPGYVLVSMSLNDPTCVNYTSINVVGGGCHCELLASHPSFAAIRVTGDLRGRTLTVEFSEAPIPV
jgi:hypothetical protein